jgi:hypothetical protein
MSTIQIAFALLVVATFIGLFKPSGACLLIAMALGVALWLEDRAHRRGNAS